MTERIAVVTGGAGFIGSHTVDALVQKGYQVRVLDDFSNGKHENLAHLSESSRVTIEDSDICSLGSRSTAFVDADIVFHFAGVGDIVPSIQTPEKYMNTNVMGTVNVLEAAREASVRRLIYAASSSCYGSSPRTPTDEDQPVKCEYPYALSKYLGEQAVFHWHRVYGMSVNSIRIFNAYGLRSRTSGAYGAVFGVFLRQKIAGQPFTVVGDGTQGRDFVHVTDVADAFVKAGESHLDGKVWNLGTGQPKTINYLVQLLGGDTSYLPRRPAEPAVTWANTQAIQNDLKWSPRVSFEEGVSEMLKHIDLWNEAPLWDEKRIAEATHDWFQYLQKGSDSD